MTIMKVILQVFLLTAMLVSPVLAGGGSNGQGQNGNGQGQNGQGNGYYGAPGPIAGAGLPLVGFGVGYGVYWLIKRRRRQA
jgi:hypothetical protein